MKRHVHLISLLITAIPAVGGLIVVVGSIASGPGGMDFRNNFVGILGFGLVALFLAAVVVGQFYQIIRHRRELWSLRHRLCSNCGYDMRATPHRCPECGTLFHRPRRPVKYIPLRDDWPANAISPRLPGPDESLVLLHSTDHSWEAQTLVEQLIMRGVAAQLVEPELGRRVYGSWRVNIWSGDVDLAKPILAKLIPNATNQTSAE